VFSVAKKLECWREELKCDSDRDFLLSGIAHGFRIADQNSDILAAEAGNHFSAFQHRDLVEKELRKQIVEGNYILSSQKPLIVSPLAAIPKDDGNIRLIHDGSRPFGAAMNDYATLHPERFQTIDDACKMAKPGYWCAKLDLKSAYRSVPIHRDDYKITGLKWQFEGDSEATYLFDSRLPFGATLAPSHFHRLSQAIRRCLRRRGWHDVVVYIDDFLVVAPSFDKCNEVLHVLIDLVRKLGFYISWEKVVGPTQKITFLGIDIDTRACTLSLCQAKLQKINEELVDFATRKRASKRQLQRLAGLLNWACQAIRGGKFFLRRILDAIRPLQRQHHKVKLTLEFKRDIDWWLTFLVSFNGVVYYNSGQTHHVHVDACQKAGGGFWRGDWYYSVFHTDLPAANNLHINYKEVCAVVQSVDRWAPQWCNSDVVVHTDSSVTKAIVNRGRSKSPLINCMLRRLFWLSVKYNFSIRAIHIPGTVNVIPDTISRLHEPVKYEKLVLLLSRWFHAKYVTCFSDCLQHMSVKAFSFLVQARQRCLKKNSSRN